MHNKQKTALIAKAHHLNPVVMIGQKGLTDNVIAEVEQALVAHELIKIKVVAEDKEQRTAMINDICTALNAVNLKLIGNIAIVYRKASE
jgi:RNA-binding protein